jgi:flagellin-like hook-associated protein FlgL
MTMTRITSGMLTTTAQRNLASAQATLAKLQDIGSSGTRVAKPSDDPAATAAV